MQEKNTIKEECLFYAYTDLYKCVEDLVLKVVKQMMLELNGFRDNYKHIYWNLIYYFSLWHLPFDFFMEYHIDDTPIVLPVNKKIAQYLENEMLSNLQKQHQGISKV